MLAYAFSFFDTQSFCNTSLFVLLKRSLFLVSGFALVNKEASGPLTFVVFDVSSPVPGSPKVSSSRVFSSTKVQHLYTWLL